MWLNEQRLWLLGINATDHDYHYGTLEINILS